MAGKSGGKGKKCRWHRIKEPMRKIQKLHVYERDPVSGHRKNVASKQLKKSWREAMETRPPDKRVSLKEWSSLMSSGILLVWRANKRAVVTRKPGRI